MKSDNMGSKNKLRTESIKARFSVVREMPYLYQETEEEISEKLKESTCEQTVLNTLEKGNGLEPETIRKLEEELRLTFVAENRVEGNVCMANSPEIRDEYKDVFDNKDLLDYIFAVLHSTRYRAKYRGSFSTDYFQIPCPDDQKVFWKLVGLGAQLREIYRFKKLSIEKHNAEFNRITENIDKIEMEEICEKEL